MLAGHSGVEFLYEFRSYSEWRNIPVIILTGVPRGELGLSDVAMTDLGVVGYLYKPETSLAGLAKLARRALLPTKAGVSGKGKAVK